MLIVVSQQLSLKMSIGYLKKKTHTKARKGISPVIATVILVAVAVVIAAALAGFSSSLFGTYSSAGSAVTVRSLTVHVDGTGNVKLVNSGNIADELVSMQVVGNLIADDPTAYSAASLNIPSNNGQLDTDFPTLGIFQEGQNITVKLTLKSGLQLTQSTIVIA